MRIKVTKRATARTNQYVDARNGGHYVAGTRIGMDLITREFRDGRSAEAIFDAYPSIGSLAKTYGAIAFVLDHPEEIDEYLREQNRRYAGFQAANPLPASMLESFESGSHELAANQT